MKALRFHQYGGPEVLQIDDVPIPEPGTGEVLVRVSGSGVNPVDWKLREGHLKDYWPLQLPAIVSREFSGTIERLGDGVSGFSVGDEIYGIADGSCADYLVAKVGDFALKPPSMDLPDSGGVPLAAMTAYQGLFDHGGIQAGQKVLIHAATGGVGSFAVQMAKWAGATVYGTASANRLDSIADFGVDVPIDYKAQRFEEVAKDVDLVLDTVGGETAERSLASLKSGGVLVSTVGAEPKRDGVRSVSFMMKPSHDQLSKISDLIQDLKVRPVIDAVVPLIRAIEAQKESQTGHIMGKLVVDVRR
ncbi:NADP-dependent oxidoreductase [bacterium]|nr:MAG: NADP-dependent oxidoreductase [bacterium]